MLFWCGILLELGYVEGIGIKCIYCGYVAHKHGVTKLGEQRYKCSNWSSCGKTFKEMGIKKVFIIHCPSCGKEVEAFKFGKVWYRKFEEIRKQRYRCVECGVVTINYVRTE